MPRRLIALGIIALAALAPPAVGAGPASAATAAAAEAPAKAVSTVGMIGDMVGEVGGVCVVGRTLMGPGVDPHLYQASARDVRTLQEADVILHVGFGLEGRLGAVLERFGETKPAVAVGPASIPASDLIATEDQYGVDPHVWMDVGLWARTVPVIVDALADLRPDCAAAIRAAAARYGDQLAALDAWVRAAVASVPAEGRVLVTAHDAFGYFGRAYGIDVVGIQGVSTESEAGVADIRAVADLLAQRRIPAVFVESTINPRTIRAVVEAARDRGHDVEVGGELHSDALGAPDTAAGTYIGMIHANTDRIVHALGGKPPPLPDALKDWAERWNAQAAQAR